MVELLQLGGGDSEQIFIVSGPCPGAPAMRTEQEPEEGRDVDLQPAEDRASEADESDPHRPAAHIRPAKFKPAERRRRRALPAGPARRRAGLSRRAQTPRCHGDAWRPRGLCPGLRSSAGCARASLRPPLMRAGASLAGSSFGTSNVLSLRKAEQGAEARTTAVCLQGQGFKDQAVLSAHSHILCEESELYPSLQVYPSMLFGGSLPLFGSTLFAWHLKAASLSLHVNSEVFLKPLTYWGLCSARESKSPALACSSFCGVES